MYEDLEKFRHTMRPAKEPMVTLPARGTAMLNKAAYELLGRPTGPHRKSQIRG